MMPLPPEIRIRSLHRSDYEQWRPLWDAYNAFYGRIGETALREQVTESTWQRFLDPREPVHGLVAERDGRIVGIAHFLFHPSTVHLDDVCYLQDLFTVVEHRGEGIGQALIAAVSERAREAGAPRVYWLTQETNERAVSLYGRLAERPGFTLFLRTP